MVVDDKPEARLRAFVADVVDSRVAAGLVDPDFPIRPSAPTWFTCRGMIDFGELKRPPAEAYCRDYADAVPIRAAWLAGELSAAGVDTDDLSEPSSVDRIWVWLTGLVDREGPLGVTLHTTLPNDDPQAGERPPWWVPDRPNPYLSDGLLWLVEAIGCHLATVARRSFPASTWRVYTSSNRRDVNNNRTQLFGVPGGPAEPSRMVYGEVIGHVVHGEPWRPDALSRLYAYLTDDQ